MACLAGSDLPQAVYALYYVRDIIDIRAGMATILNGLTWAETPWLVLKKGLSSRSPSQLFFCHPTQSLPRFRRCFKTRHPTGPSFGKPCVPTTMLVPEATVKKSISIHHIGYGTVGWHGWVAARTHDRHAPWAADLLVSDAFGACPNHIISYVCPS